MFSATNISNNETVYHKKSTIEHAINSHIFTEKKSTLTYTEYKKHTSLHTNQLSHIQKSS